MTPQPQPRVRSTRARARGKAENPPTPTLEREEIEERVCDAIAAGRSIESVCAEPGMPTSRTIRRWLREPGPDGDRFRAAHDQARLEAGDRVGQRVMEIAEAVLAGRIPPEAGRVAIDAAKWTAARANRAKWGDRSEIDANIPGGMTVRVVMEDAGG